MTPGKRVDAESKQAHRDPRRERKRAITLPLDLHPRFPASAVGLRADGELASRSFVSTPEVSVVMAVCNGGAGLPSTLESVLSQEDVDLEFIIVDDGSTDETPRILADAASRDARVRIVSRENTGLTMALIAGCATASAPVIARQDAGDRSLPGRLARQLSAIRARPGAVMVACGTRYVTSVGEWLNDVSQAPDELHARLGTTERSIVRGPSHHGAVAFRRDAYEAVGGYRSAFRVAQDLDLWMRLRERGLCVSLREIGYEARFAPCSISFRNKAEQEASVDVILRAAAARRRGDPDAAIVAAHQATQASRGPTGSRLTAATGRVEAGYYYFVARMIERRDPTLARQYMCTAIQKEPANIKFHLQYIRLNMLHAIQVVGKRLLRG